MKFQPGDVVMLKSGGAAMTVDKPEVEPGDNMVLCFWHTTMGEQKYFEFPEHVLLKIEPKPEPEDDDYVFTGDDDEAEK